VRFLSSTVGSEPVGKFFTLLDSSTAYKNADSSHSSRRDLIGRLLSKELLGSFQNHSGNLIGTDDSFQLAKVLGSVRLDEYVPPHEFARIS